MKEIITIYIGFTTVICIFLLYAISLSEIVYDMDYVLSENKEFWKCVFMYQVAVYKLAENTINTLGIVILEVLTTALCLHFNIVIFIFLFLLLLIKYICKLFYIIFKKR